MVKIVLISTNVQNTPTTVIEMLIVQISLGHLNAHVRLASVVMAFIGAEMTMNANNILTTAMKMHPVLTLKEASSVIATMALKETVSIVKILMSVKITHVIRTKTASTYQAALNVFARRASSEVTSLLSMPAS